MSENILVPVLGESITEATVSKWLKNEGDSVEADEPIVELETDKVNLEVPSPVSGVLIKINSKDGSVVKVGALLGAVSGNGSKKGFLKEAEKLPARAPQPRRQPDERRGASLHCHHNRYACVGVAGDADLMAKNRSVTARGAKARPTPYAGTKSPIQ